MNDVDSILWVVSSADDSQIVVPKYFMGYIAISFKLKVGLTSHNVAAYTLRHLKEAHRATA